jgi:cysteine desulfurase/selenocysteine lyase
VIPLNDRGEIIYDEYRKLLTDRVKLVAICQVSNALGTVNPVREMIADAHALGIPVLVDGAQAVPHAPVDVVELGCDFYCFSGHKMYGPTGIGVLFGRRDLLEEMPPWQGGGDMIERVSFEGTTFNELPYKFEAGTPNIAGGIALAAAIEYIERIGVERIAAYEHDLLVYATERVQELEGVRILGTARHKAGVLSMVLDGIHPYDAGTILDQLGIAVRTGHHCTQPLMERFGLPGTVRASFAFYNTREEVDALVAGLRRVQTLFA